jgi:hypothetical protein
MMNVYLVELPVGEYSWGDDYAMVIVAEDELHAERKARWSSYNFKEAKNINISQVNLNEEAVVLTANVGG